MRNWLISILMFVSVVSHASAPGGLKSTANATSCPEGYVWKLSRSWGCYPKDKNDVDPSCDAKLSRSVTLKQTCYQDENATACIMAGTVAGAAAGGFLQKYSGTLLKSQPASFQSKLNQIIVELDKAEVLHKAAYDKLYSIRRNKVIESLGVDSKTHRFYGLERFRDESYVDTATKKKYDQGIQNGNDEFSELIKAETDPEMKEAMKGVLKGTDLSKIKSNSMPWGKLFPKEYKELKKFIDVDYEMAERYDRLMENSAPSNKMSKEERRDYKEKLESITKAVKENNTAMESYIKSRPNSSRLNSFNDIRSYSTEALRTSYRSSIDAKAERIELQNKKDANLSAKRAGVTATVAGGIAGTVISVAAVTADAQAAKRDISDCQKYFGFSKEEVEFLGSKAKKYGSGCDSLGFISAQESTAQLEEAFGGVPKGICKMLKQQNQNMDKQMDSKNPNENINMGCGSMSGTSYKVYADDAVSPVVAGNRNKDIFEYQNGEFIYKMPFTVNENYPDISRAVVFNKDGKENKNETIALKDSYAQIHGSVVSQRRDLVDAFYDCGKNSSAYCRLDNKVLQKVRVARSMKEFVCSMEGSSAESSSGGETALPSSQSATQK